MTNRQAFRISRSNDQPDEIVTRNGIYKVWLVRENRDRFRAAIETCFELIETTNVNEDDEARGRSQSIEYTTDHRQINDPNPITSNIASTGPKGE